MSTAFSIPPCRAQSEGTLSSITPRRRPQNLSPRAYQARLDLCRLYDLTLAGKTQAEIATIMGKDRAWVSRSVKRIREDFSTVFERPQATQLIDEHLAQLDSLHRQTMQTAENSTGAAKVAAMRLAMDLLSKRAEYLRNVGLLPNGEQQQAGAVREGEWISVSDMQQEISPANMQQMIVEMADDIRRREHNEARFRFPPSPLADSTSADTSSAPRVFGLSRIA